MNTIKKTIKLFILLTLTVLMSKCSPTGDIVKPTPAPTFPVVINEMDFWLTKGNQSVMLQKQTSVLAFGTTFNN